MNKNAIIIGGTSGIGLHTARYLRDAGYKVLIGGRNAVESESGIDYLKIDVTNESSIEQFFRTIPFQHIDSMIYAAGITTIKKNIQDFDKKKYQRVHDVNLLGAILTFKYAWKF